MFVVYKKSVAGALCIPPTIRKFLWLLVFWPMSNYAAVTTYLDPNTFGQNTNILAIENFNVYSEVVDFSDSQVDTGDFTLIHRGGFLGQIEPLIEHANETWATDGTPFVLFSTGSSPPFDEEIQLEIVFDNPIYSFGADFGLLNLIEPRTQIVVDFGIGLQTTLFPPEILNGFYGFTSNIAFNSVLFSSAPNISANVGIDNIRYSFSPVPISVIPIPGAFWLFSSAFLGLTALKRKQLYLAN